MIHVWYMLCAKLTFLIIINHSQEPKLNSLDRGYSHYFVLLVAYYFTHICVYDKKRRDNCLIMVCVDPKIGIHFTSDIQVDAWHHVNFKKIKLKIKFVRLRIIIFFYLVKFAVSCQPSSLRLDVIILERATDDNVGHLICISVNMRTTEIFVYCSSCSFW